MTDFHETFHQRIVIGGLPNAMYTQRSSNVADFCSWSDTIPSFRVVIMFSCTVK